MYYKIVAFHNIFISMVDEISLLNNRIEPVLAYEGISGQLKNSVFFQKSCGQKKPVTKNRQSQNDREQNIFTQYEGSSLIAIILILFYSHS